MELSNGIRGDTQDISQYIWQWAVDSGYVGASVDHVFTGDLSSMVWVIRHHRQLSLGLSTMISIIQVIPFV